MLSEQTFTEHYNNASSRSDLCQLVYGYINKKSMVKIAEMADQYNLCFNGLDKRVGTRRIKYKKITSICPVCTNEFEAQEGHKRQKKTCSHSCANTFFRSGLNAANQSDTGYRRICFGYHEKQCLICQESLIVTVHHYDEDHANNKPENLMPLCPTHHQYWHSKYKNLVKPKIDEYRNDFITQHSPII